MTKGFPEGGPFRKNYEVLGELSFKELPSIVQEVMHNNKLDQAEYSQNLRKVDQILSKIETKAKNSDFFSQTMENDYALFLELENFVNIVGDHILADLNGEYGVQVQMSQENQEMLGHLHERFTHLKAMMDQEEDTSVRKAA
ncbi:MAG: hypothetical protein COV59_04750 [Candidatus Magasanikbacteria bacterium CG11_big_fil_rev_8_21_14_0_20_39_34]|uniref:Uncharacterized protein n=1 Tax=Candidatus Magasanikbacteria bacterium CG11_big_fil_rev_8_21_14_0_20_39_34 TaxID=1974653 RepID=A0A2H0N4C5_9BACT|nr:MAG: hypothetical protein COV59_04750 [Candidatus Magasanikbacteria bacterium CG11_big_fil_rev_8_21_14_0_20_39_34]